MLTPSLDTNWPDSWKTAFAYDLIEVFGQEAPRLGHARAYAQRMARTLSLFCDAVPPGARVIDIAAAQGNFSLRLAELGYDVTWNDLREDLAGYVKLKHESGRLRFEAGNVFELAAGEEYDAVLITEIIEHVAHPDAFLEQIARLVRPGGHVIMTTPNGQYFANRLPKFSRCRDPGAYEAAQFRPDGDGHIFLLHEDEISGLARAAGLDVMSVGLFTPFMSAGRLGADTLLRAAPLSVFAAIDALCTRLPVAIARRVYVPMAVCFRKPDSWSAGGI